MLAVNKLNVIREKQDFAFILLACVFVRCSPWVELARTMLSGPDLLNSQITAANLHASHKTQQWIRWASVHSCNYKLEMEQFVFCFLLRKVSAFQTRSEFFS